MSRLVRVPGAADRSEGAASPDNYLERLAKYVPGEVLAFFLFINVILEQAQKSGGDGARMAGLPVTVVAQGALVVGLVLTPLFVWYVRQKGDAWLTNAVVSTLAFPFWAYALGAVAFADYWDGNLAAILLATVTVFSGLISPPRPQAAKQQSAAPVPIRTERPRLDLIGPNPA